jgi:MoaA/NifB/PqqE/SkfB family radical SAM enzyme
MSGFDVIFLSNGEPNADENWRRLLSFHPAAKRVSGSQNVKAGLLRCADAAEHERFYLVDAEAWVLEGFQFRLPEPDTPGGLFTWAARNPVNDLVQANGGIKLLSRSLVRKINSASVDGLSSEADRKYLPDVASESRFNSAPFFAWRGAFCECARRAASAHDETRARLERELAIWQTVGADRPHGRWAILGARQGARYGVDTRRAPENLLTIGDIGWLRQRFSALTAEIASKGHVTAARVSVGAETDARSVHAVPRAASGGGVSSAAAPAHSPPQYLFMTINQRCNLRCQHCNFWTLNDDDRERYLSDDRRSEILAEFAELNPQGTVVTVGGESMLDLDEYFHIARQCRTLGLINRTVVNGTRIRSPELADRLIREGPHEIAVSLNSHRQELHDRTRGVDGAFKKAVGALRLLLDARARHPGAGTSIYVSTFIFDENYRELEALHEFVLNEIGADKVSLNCLQPSFGSHPDGDEFFAQHRDVDPDLLGAILDGCDEKFDLRLNPVWKSQVKMYFRSLRANLNPRLGWGSGETEEHICNSYDRNIMVDLYGTARLCFSPTFRGARLRRPGDLRTFWHRADPIRDAMKKCNSYCGIASCARREDATWKGRIRD